MATIKTLEEVESWKKEHVRTLNLKPSTKKSLK
jgi:hypothetical protein